MRALSSLLLAGAVGLGALALAPATAEAHGGWRGRDYYGQSYLPPVPRPALPYYGYGPPAYYRPGPPANYRPVPPPVYFGPGPGFYGSPGVYGVPRSYGIPPGPGVGLWGR